MPVLKRCFSSVCVMITLFGCDQNALINTELQSQIDSLQYQLDKSYKPGLGEFMSSVQVHHEKLWFAGKYQNWELANFEINEIKESLEDIQNYCADRPEVKSISMINPAIDSLTRSIQHKDGAGFKTGFILLTATCNNCHRNTDHGFNLIQLPETPPFSNQEFRKPD